MVDNENEHHDGDGPTLIEDGSDEDEDDSDEEGSAPENNDEKDRASVLEEVGFVLPDLAQRRSELSARMAYWSHVLATNERDFHGVPLRERGWLPVAMCRACGVNTGNWCDTCEELGYTFTSHFRQELVGSPLCTRCEDEVVCPVCVDQD